MGEISDAGSILLLVTLQNALLLALTVGIFWTCILIVRLLGRSASFSLSPLGFRVPRAGYPAGVCLGLIVGIGALIASMPVNVLSTFVSEYLGHPVEATIQEPLMRSVEEWVRTNPETAIPVTIAVIVFFGPFVEEVIFRAAIFGGLYRLALLLSARLVRSQAPKGRPKEAGSAASFIVAALASSLSFSALHFEPVLLPSLMILAFALCALYRWSGSILAPFIAHATFNSFATTLLILGGLNAIPTPV